MLEIFQTLFAPPRHIIFLVVSAWLGMVLAERHAQRHAINREALSNLIFYALLAWILGGRLLYAAAHLTAFVQSPASLISPNTALFDPLGAAASALIAAWMMGRRRQLSLWQTMDALTPFLAVLAVGVGLSHLAAGAAFGKATEVPWAVDLWNARRHPSQLYEILAALVILAIVGFQRGSLRPGILFLVFASLTAAARLFLEAFRGDSQLMPGGFRLAQILAWLALVLIFFLIEMRLRAGRQRSPSQARGEEPAKTVLPPY